MPADRRDRAATHLVGSDPVERCDCGRLAVARCWLGENSPARWLFPCRRPGGLPPDAPEAA